MPTFGSKIPNKMNGIGIILVSVFKRKISSIGIIPHQFFDYYL
jgi:hypothetical protein